MGGAFYQPVPSDLLYAHIGGPPHDWNRLDIFLDGVQVRNVIEANVAQNYVIRFKTDDKGMYVVNPYTHRTETERVGGVVVVKRRS